MDDQNKLSIYGDLCDEGLFSRIQAEYPQITSTAIKKGFGTEQWAELTVTLVVGFVNIVTPVIAEWLKYCLERKKKNAKATIIFSNGKEETVIRLNDLADLTLDNVDIVAKDYSLKIEKLCIRNKVTHHAKN